MFQSHLTWLCVSGRVFSFHKINLRHFQLLNHLFQQNLCERWNFFSMLISFLIMFQNSHCWGSRKGWRIRVHEKPCRCFGGMFVARDPAHWLDGYGFKSDSVSDIHVCTCWHVVVYMNFSCHFDTSTHFTSSCVYAFFLFPKPQNYSGRLTLEKITRSMNVVDVHIFQLHALNQILFCVFSR